MKPNVLFGMSAITLSTALLLPASLSSTLTIIEDINPKEEFTGTYKDTSGNQHGFLQLADGSAPITIDCPNAVTSIAMGLDPEGPSSASTPIQRARLMDFWRLL